MAKFVTPQTVGAVVLERLARAQGFDCDDPEVAEAIRRLAIQPMTNAVGVANVEPLSTSEEHRHVDVARGVVLFELLEAGLAPKG